ncbi:MAG: aminoacyl-tRNA hydrolase [Peptococcaceae bacterium]|nr:aminoacyl-tRNA hydrolase [Peptococcaceae bacterium]
MKLIVGLGNPGAKYARTRHNAGFMMADLLAEFFSAGSEKKHFQALVRQADTAAGRILLVKPQSYMNLSGDSLGDLLHYYNDAVEGFLVVHDDLDMPLGRLRFKIDGGSGGHKGLKSITSRMGTDRYDRLKLGIGRPPALMAVEAYVLQAFSDNEKKIFDLVLAKGVEGIRCWLTDGIVNAMNRYNAENLDPASVVEEASAKGTSAEETQIKEVSINETSE